MKEPCPTCGHSGPRIDKLSPRALWALTERLVEGSITAADVVALDEAGTLEDHLTGPKLRVVE